MIWDIYDELIEQVPSNMTLKRFLSASHWNLAETDAIGMSMVPREGNGRVAGAGTFSGMNAKDAAAKIKSWNNHEAAFGLSVINSVINNPDKIFALTEYEIEKDSNVSLFEYMREDLRGKKVAVIGHFCGIDSLNEICTLSILERFPQPGDFPDPACEYILPEQDYVFITGTTLINKTLPRLLELSKNAQVAIVGPSTPMSGILFKHGASIAAGTAVLDKEKVWNLIQEGDQHRFFSEGGQMIKISLKRPL